MPPFAECCVIIPCSTIEDFPSRLDSAGARSLLGGLTVAWHPRLIASMRRAPSWHRSDDSPPPIRVPAPGQHSAGNEPGGESTTLRRLLIIPEVCVSTLPADVREGIDRDAVSLHELPVPEDLAYHAACEVRVRVSSRSDALEKLSEAATMFSPEGVSAPWQSSGDAPAARGQAKLRIDERDFFALGYTWWQTQILTRRLRYTSNLDQIYFETRLVVAAENFVAGDVAAATEALHDCYDALAEERDHYFSSDPAIVDLTLLTPGTLDSWLDRLSSPSLASEGDAAATDRTGLDTPENILVDEAVAAAILSGDADRRERFRASLKFRESDSPNPLHEAIGWCGGGPSCDFSFDASSIASCEARITAAIQTVQESGASPVTVYARLGGGVAGEWVPAIAAAGFRGIIPIDFLGGRGFDDESKVLLGEGDHEIEALTAKPIDADDDTSFLTLAAKMGEAIDRGEIATALLVHWPGGGCESFHDVRRAASWSLCLGKFWRIDEYFIEGERPFHHGASPNSSPAPVQTVGELYERRAGLAADLQLQRDNNLRGFAALLDPARFVPAAAPTASANHQADFASELPQLIATSIGYSVDVDASHATTPPANTLLLHPAHPATRTGVTVAGNVSAKFGSIFHAEATGGTTKMIADVPGWGFTLVGAAATKHAGDDANSPSAIQRALRWFSGGPKKMIDGNQFSNEFMETTIDRVHGGVDAVYSGPGRGNRFSMRLMLSPRSKVDPESKTDATQSPWQTMCTRMETMEDSRHRAVMALEGEFRPNPDASAPATERNQSGSLRQATKWQAQYRLERGSRRLLYRVRFDAGADQAAPIGDAWKTCPVLRMAMAEASPIVRAISREKLIRTSARSFTSSLGFVIDEESRSTLIACAGASVHRRCGNRFFDTVIATPYDDSEQWTPWQTFAFGFDVGQSVTSAKSFATGDEITSVPVKIDADVSLRASRLPQRGWLMHPSPKSLDVQVVSVGRVHGEGDAPEWMALHLRVIQTAGRSVSASLRFCRDVHTACEVSSLSRPFEFVSASGGLSLAQLQEISNADSITCQGDRVSWSQRSHGVIHIVVLFPLSKQA